MPEAIACAFHQRFATLDADWRTFPHDYLLYASSGAFQLDVDDATWALPPHRAALIERLRPFEAILCMRETSESAELRLALLTDGYDVESIEPEMLLSFAQTREGFVIADIDRAATLQAVCRLQESATPAIDLVVIASTDTTLLAKVNQLVTRGVGALFVKPVAPEALLTKLRFLRPRPARASNPPRAHSSRPRAVASGRGRRAPGRRPGRGS